MRPLSKPTDSLTHPLTHSPIHRLTDSPSFLPYGHQYIDDEDIEAVVEVLKSDFLTQGPKVKEFEDRLAEYCGAKYAVAVSNGTAALFLVSKILLNPGDKVLTTPNSFVATSNSILLAGAKPVFVDIKSDGNIDLDKCIEVLKSDRDIKALYVVHFSGNPVDLEKLAFIREKYGVKIVEDAAHALGAKYTIGNSTYKIGSCEFSDAAIFSFHPVKNITTGEGGAILTNDENIYEKLLMLRSHGITKDPNRFTHSPIHQFTNSPTHPFTDSPPLWYYEMQDLSHNFRITDFQCALGVSQLKKLDFFVEKRREIALRYEQLLQDTPFRPLYKFNENSAYHLYVVRADFSKMNISKSELFLKMKEKGIGLQLHYIPINKQPYYQKLGYGNENLPEMYRYYEEAFSLPIFVGLTDEEQEYVVECLKNSL